MLQSASSLIETQFGVSEEVRSLLSSVSASSKDLKEISQLLNDRLEAQVESKIKKHHESTKAAIAQRFAAVSSQTSQLFEQKGAADAADATCQACVSNEKETLEQTEVAEAKSVTDKAAMEQACAPLARLAVLKVEPDVPDMACDLSTEGSCSSQLLRFDQKLDQMIALTRARMETGAASWKAAKGKCDAATKAHTEQVVSAASLRRDWQRKHGECLKLQTGVKADMCSFGSAYQAKCKAVADYMAFMEEVDQVNGGMYSHPDRLREWTATQMIKCVVSNLTKGGETDAQALKSCEGQVNFDASVGLLDDKRAEVRKLTAPAQFTCAETSVSFAGGRWKVPEGEEVSSRSYARSEEWSPKISARQDRKAFDFCPDKS